MKKNNAFRRAAALIAALSITVSLAAPAFADTYYIDYGDITITKNEDGSQTIEQGGDKWTDKAGEETVITTSNTVITTLESDLEGPAAEDSDFGPVVEDNYQSAQPESTEESEDADQPEIAEEPKSADRQESADQQAVPVAAPAGATPVNKKDDGFWGNTITVINNIADKVLNLTLKDVKIDVSDTGDQYDWDQKGKAALSVQGKGNVEIELDGDNELKSGTHRAGLEKNTSTSTGTLTLKDDKKDDKEAGIGSLKATGGQYAAGIGNGGYYGNGGNRSGENITITGGTVNAAGAVGLAAAIDYLTAIGWDKLHAQEVALTDFALQGLRAMPYVHVIGAEKAEDHCGILTFTVDGVHPHDISAILDAADVAIRAGHHCAQPLMQHLGTPSTARASLFFYNTEEEVQRFLDAVASLRRQMGYGE